MARELRRVFTAFVALLGFAVVYAYLVDYDRKVREISELSGEVNRLERYVPLYRACREAADTGHALGWAWHDWVHDQTQARVDRVEDLQRIQGGQLAACGLVPPADGDDFTIEPEYGGSAKLPGMWDDLLEGGQS